MNCILMELVQTMCAAMNLSKFLWKEATAHVVYLQNRAYTLAVKGSTLYQKWHSKRPNIAHLREFGAPV
jgi:hypothetical protein